MAKQQIPLVKVRFLDNFTDPANPREMFRPGIMRQAVITNEKLIQNICNHSGQKEAQVIAVLAALPDAVKDYATAGHSVQIDNLCTISPVIHCKAVDTPEECNAQTIKSVGVKVLPIGKSAALYKKWAFRMVGDVVTGTANGDDGGVEDPGNGGNQQQGNQQQTPTTVTLLFQFQDGTEQRVTGEPGAAVNVPANTAGYVWDSVVPATFPDEDVSFTEVADTRPTHTVTYRDADMEEFDVQTVHEGAPIIPPTPPTGYHWVDVPAVMPSNDINIRCAADA